AIASSDPRLLDWPQKLGSSADVYVANTGFGYGDTDSIAYGERVMSLLAGQLGGRQSTAGQALMYAKQQYIADNAVPGVYDAKAAEEATFYGLPMYRIGQDGAVGAPALPRDKSGTSPTQSSTFDVHPDNEPQE